MNEREQRHTFRPCSEGAEDFIGGTIDVLDHGFVRVVDYMGDDAAIVQAARVSYGKGTKSVSDDRALIRYLVRNRHTSPLEMCELKLHCKMPIFVARQWIRHRTANVNEYSGRYSVMSDDYYLPSIDVICAQSDVNKQSRGESMHPKLAEKTQRIVSSVCDTAKEDYELLLAQGTARELARIVLPVNFYTEWYWKTDLHNLLHFLHLRLHPYAQWEIRQYAEAILEIVRQWVPITYEAFMDYIVNAQTLSVQQSVTLLKILKHAEAKSPGMIAETIGTWEENDMTRREWDELREFMNDE
jgi:thymidylate synthase (FAD)